MGYWKSDKSDQSLHYSKYNSLSYIQLSGDLVFLQARDSEYLNSSLILYFSSSNINLSSFTCSVPKLISPSDLTSHIL